MDGSTENPPAVSSACPHCGRPVRSATSSLRPPSDESGRCEGGAGAPSRSRRSVPVEDLRTHGLM
jgi:hypothetical protein